MAIESLRGRVAVVTGASRGLGRAFAQALAAEGCMLALVSRNGAALEELARSLPTKSSVHSCDVSDANAVAALFTDIKKQHGRVDILINNAGIATANQSVADFNIAQWQEVMRVNVDGTFFCSKFAIPLMGTGATIVNIASVAAQKVFPNLSAYTVSKQAVVAFSGVLREELRPRQIRVLVLTPGAVDTDIWEQFWPDAPRERMIKAEDVAAMLVTALKMPVEATVEHIFIGSTAGAL
jgi:NAD(P)-dependent dehydrogenase (short-subunit alcohol dehydrogenase family)